MSKKGQVKNNFKNQLKNVSREMRRNFTITTYQKAFDDFAAGIDELRSIDPFIASILGEEELTPDTAAKKMIEAYTNNVPSLENRENIFWSLNSSATKCIVKTNNYISFGWQFKYNAKNKEEVELSNIVMKVTILRENQEITSKAKELGWEEIPNK